ncbi:MAG: S-layer homology domain-containing protein, partial [Clostridiales bacterium]
KNYSIKNTEGTNLGNVTVDITADIYGYNQYWSNTETILYKYLINGENIIDNASDKWGGEVDLTTSSSVSNELVYMKNAPEIISFTGGYINRQYNNNILEYTSSLPEFDQNNRATDLINKKHESYTIDSYPKQQRLMSVDFSELRGHWAELDIKKLFGLEVLTKVNNFKAEKTTTRGEYITRVYNCAKEIPIDPLFKKNKDNENKNIKYESPFKDVPNNHPDIKEIVESFNRGIIEGNGDGYFGLDENLKFIDAVVILVRVMGLDKINSLGRNVYFKDESDIPFYAKNAVNIAYRIGLIKGDNYGYLKPQEKLTNARSSALLVRFIDYLSEGIKDDYRDGILTY